MRQWIDLFEGYHLISVKPMYRPAFELTVADNPTRTQMMKLSRLQAEDAPQLRGLIYRGGFVVWAAGAAVHIDVAEAMGHADAFSETDTPGENAFQIRIEGQQIIYVGNPDFAVSEIANFTRLFDLIDLMGDETTEYEPSEWGLPARFGGWSHYL